MGGPAKGFLPAAVGPMGELTEVASAKRAVRGDLRDKLEVSEEVLGRTVIWGTFFSPAAGDSARGADIL